MHACRSTLEDPTCGIALDSDDAPLPAYFNWALALEQLSNRAAAIQAWERYLLRDSTSGWADEARSHLAQLRVPPRKWEGADEKLFNAGADAQTLSMLLARYPGRVRNWTQNRQLLLWLREGRPEQLQLLRSVASFFAAAGDPFLSDIVENAVARTDALRKGLEPYTEARTAEKARLPKEAAAHYAEAAQTLAEAGSPLAITASIFAANTISWDKRYDEALAMLDRVESQLAGQGNRYAAMSAEAAWSRGVILARTGRPQESLDALRKAEEFARRAGERDNAVSIREMTVAQLELLGDRAQADQERLNVLRQSQEANLSAGAVYNAYVETTICALRAGRPHLALAFADSTMQLAHEIKQPFELAQSKTWRAMALLENGRTVEAAASAAAARLDAREVKAADWRDSLAADAHFVSARIAEADRQPGRAVADYTAAITLWKENRRHVHLATGLTARGEAYLASGNRVNAEGDFRTAIAEMEGQRAGLDEPQMRLAYFERADRPFERLTEMLVDDGRMIDAISVVERKRARVLLDEIGGGVATPLDGSAIRDGIHGRTALLQIALLERGAELWLMQDGELFHARSEASGKAIEEALARQLTAFSGGNDVETTREGRWLYDQLIAPVSGRLAAGVPLVIVPDGALQALPYATLTDQDGVYLVERHALTLAPSATVFLRAPSASSGQSVLAVAQPAPRDLDRLPFAASEATFIAGRRQGQVRIGEEISPAAFLDAAARAALVHFAGHASTDRVHPAGSALLFESRSGPPLRLTAEEIGRGRLASHPLVVLAACSTARGTLHRNEGIDSLAAAFLQAGARGVVATLWDVDDARSAPLFRSFHENLRRGARPADALRQAQQSLIHSSNPQERRPSTWGSAVVIGTL